MPDIAVRSYAAGDIDRIPVAEADPYVGWSGHIEANGKGLRSYTIDGALVAVTYYMPVWDGVGEACALLNRELASGHGAALARVVRREIDAIMAADHLHRVQAAGDPNDRAACVFLRAIGFRRESLMKRAAPDKTDLIMTVILEKET